MSTKPPDMPEQPDPSDAYIRTLAGIEITLEQIAKDQASIKGELGRITPQLDRLAAEVRECTRLVHHQARVIERLTNETSELVQTRIILEKTISDLKIDAASRALDLERAIAALTKDQEFQAGRLRRLRDDVADHVSAEAGDEGPSGIMDKQRM